MSEASRAEVCVAAIVDVFRGSGEILVSCFGSVPAVAARVAKLTCEPDILLTDGIATLIENVEPVSGPKGTNTPEAWMPFRSVFDLLWNGRRHVMMMASQIDRHGNQNFACIGPHEKPKAQLLGMRGAPGNTINHTTSYWVPNHSQKTFVDRVDVVSGVGHDRAKALGPRSSRFHDVPAVVSSLGVFDFETPEKRMRLRSVHPGVTVDEVVEQTGFPLVIEGEIPTSRGPTDEELRLIREVVDPEAFIAREVQG